MRTLVLAILCIILSGISYAQDSLSRRESITIDFTDNFNLRDRTSYLGPAYGISSFQSWRQKFGYAVGLNFLPHDDLFKNVIGFNASIVYYPFGDDRKLSSYAILSTYLAMRKVKDVEVILLPEYSLTLINPKLFRLTKQRIGLGYGADFNLSSKMFLSLSGRINWEYGQYEWNYTGNFEDNYYEDYNDLVIDGTISIGYKF